MQAEFIAQFYHAAKKKHFRLKLANKTLKNGSDNLLLTGIEIPFNSYTYQDFYSR